MELYASTLLLDGPVAREKSSCDVVLRCIRTVYIGILVCWRLAGYIFERFLPLQILGRTSDFYAINDLICAH